jgi:uncharacterized membrane protein
MSRIDRKALVSAVIGLAIALVPVLLGAPELAPLIGWAVAGCVFLVWAWAKAWRAGPEATGELALQEGRSRRLVDSLIIRATFVSPAVVFALIRSQRKDPIGVAAAILAALRVVVAWALVNTVYAFTYARMYYHDDRHRFRSNQDEDASYGDFAYGAFSIGMAFARGTIA